jgi:hypothetical protein
MLTEWWFTYREGTGNDAQRAFQILGQITPEGHTERSVGRCSMTPEQIDKHMPKSKGRWKVRTCLSEKICRTGSHILERIYLK